LADAADRCWKSIQTLDLKGFAKSYQDSINAQIAMFRAMIQGSVESYIDKYRDVVMAYKMPGAGGGGYLACVVEDAMKFVDKYPEAIVLKIRRNNS
jgi:hypothetical protein